MWETLPSGPGPFRQREGVTQRCAPGPTEELPGTDSQSMRVDPDRPFFDGTGLSQWVLCLSSSSSSFFFKKKKTGRRGERGKKVLDF